MSLMLVLEGHDATEIWSGNETNACAGISYE